MKLKKQCGTAWRHEKYEQATVKLYISRDNTGPPYKIIAGNTTKSKSAICWQQLFLLNDDFAHWGDSWLSCNKRSVAVSY